MSTTIRMSLPADPAFAVVARATAASIAAGSRATLDGVEDARVVASELFALALSSADPSSLITLTFSLTDDDIAVEARVTASGHAPSQDSFAWAILEGLMEGLELELQPSDGVEELCVRGRLRLQVPA